MHELKCATIISIPWRGMVILLKYGRYEWFVTLCHHVCTVIKANEVVLLSGEQKLGHAVSKSVIYNYCYMIYV